MHFFFYRVKDIFLLWQNHLDIFAVVSSYIHIFSSLLFVRYFLYWYHSDICLIILQNCLFLYVRGCDVRVTWKWSEVHRLRVHKQSLHETYREIHPLLLQVLICAIILTSFFICCEKLKKTKQLEMMAPNNLNFLQPIVSFALHHSCPCIEDTPGLGYTPQLSSYRGHPRPWLYTTVALV